MVFIRSLRQSELGGMQLPQWKGVDESDIDPSLLGKDGEYSWVL